MKAPVATDLPATIGGLSGLRSFIEENGVEAACCPSDLCPGAQQSRLSGRDAFVNSRISGYVQRFKAADTRVAGGWQDSVDGILEQGRVCADVQADRELVESQREEFRHSINVDRTRFSKLKTIGEAEQLRKPSIKSLLPPHHTTIHQIATMDIDALKAALDQGIIHPEVTRTEIENWASARGIRRVRSNNGNVPAQIPALRVGVKENDQERARKLPEGKAAKQNRSSAKLAARAAYQSAAEQYAPLCDEKELEEAHAYLNSAAARCKRRAS